MNFFYQDRVSRSRRDLLATIFFEFRVIRASRPTIKGTETSYLKAQTFIREIFFYFIMYFSLPESIPPRPLGGTGVRRQWSASLYFIVG